MALRHHATDDGEDEPSELVVGPLRLDLVHHEAALDGQPLDLTPKELDFLAYLAHNVGRVCTRRMILEHVWGPCYAKELHYLKVYAYRLRRKLDDEKGELLQSDPSVGYRLVVPSGWRRRRGAPLSYASSTRTGDRDTTRGVTVASRGSVKLRPCRPRRCLPRRKTTGRRCR